MLNLNQGRLTLTSRSGLQKADAQRWPSAAGAGLPATVRWKAALGVTCCTPHPRFDLLIEQIIDGHGRVRRYTSRSPTTQGPSALAVSLTVFTRPCSASRIVKRVRTLLRPVPRSDVK